MIIEPRMLPTSEGSIALHDLARTEHGEPLLISHATGFHARCYQPLADSLGLSDFDVVGLDHRGHGHTPAPLDWSVDWRAFGRDTAEVARQVWQGSPVVGFGHSMGGAALLMAAAAAPDLFHRLVLFEPITPSAELVGDSAIEPADSDLATGALRRRARFDSVDTALANFSRKPPLSVLHPESLEMYVRYGFAPVNGGPEIELRCRPELESATYASAADNGVWDLLPTVTTPVTVVSGAVVADTPAAWARRIADRLPNGNSVEFSDQDHFGPLSHPAENAGVVTSGASTV